MIKKKLEIQGDCSMTSVTWENNEWLPSASIEYISRGDYWHGDTDIDIDKEKAIEIIKHLKETFSI